MSAFANRIFVFFLLFASTLFAHSQIVLVTAADMNRSTGELQRFERMNQAWKKVGEHVTVNLGRNGLGWGLGKMNVLHGPQEPIKQEGDGRAPAGIFALGPAFGYAPASDSRLPYLQATDDLICVDDSVSRHYNQVITARPDVQTRSFEWMRRPDGLYRMGVVVQHNRAASPGAGSCIFLHLQRAPGAGTAGCTSMDADTLNMLLNWLDPKADPLLVQVPLSVLPQLQNTFRGLTAP